MTQSIEQIFMALYSLGKPVVFLLIIAFLLLPRTIDGSKNPREVAKAFFHYLMEGVGVLLMSISAFHTVISILDEQSYNTEVYLGLLLFFAAGGILFLWSDSQVRVMKEEHTVVPSVLFFFLIKTVGYLSILFAALAVAWTLALGVNAEPGWWKLPAIVLGYGIILSWFTANTSFRFPFFGVMSSAVESVIIDDTPKKAAPVKKKARSKK